MIQEKKRLESEENWKKWGPYLSERQWGTVREDYSNTGDAWGYFSHQQSKSRAYRWGEDGLAGISDDKQILCLALALWNENDPILKERLFGLTNDQGNHGEDVKEYYFYLDNTPTHSYMKYLYKYPHRAYPYEELVETGKKRSKHELEYELLDTGIFDDNRYFDVFVEYAKESAADIGIRLTIVNKGPEKAPIHILPTLWFRNTWSWEENSKVPQLELVDENGQTFIKAYHTDAEEHYEMGGDYFLFCEGNPQFLFTNNETNNKKLFDGENVSEYTKEGINNYVVKGIGDGVNPENFGTKVSPHYRFEIDAGESKTVYLRLTNNTEDINDKIAGLDKLFAKKIAEADEFYSSIMLDSIKSDKDKNKVFRQSMSGLLWTKQVFNFDVSKWLQEKGITPWTPGRKFKKVRNKEWHHLDSKDIISMPDKWEYPWFAAWDLAFHMLPFYDIDPVFTKDQLYLVLGSEYMHPNGQIPAYEWNFSDVNPPVHAWAVIETYLKEKTVNNDNGDKGFLRYCFGKLLLNFNWWINRKDIDGNNLFQGGFLGLDNIGVFDRSSELPTGGHLAQADGTAWMAFFSLQMLRISFELAMDDSYYETYIYKFFMHSMWISGSMDRVGIHDDELWDEEDGFFYDLLHFPDGTTTRLKIRSLVGLLPLMSVGIVPDKVLDNYPRVRRRVIEFMNRYAEISHNMHQIEKPGINGRKMISIINEKKLRLILTRMLDENEFLSPFGIRSMSLYHKDNPYIFHWGDEEFKVQYLPGESDSGMFGGNSNWRGPVWIPANALLLDSLLNYYTYYGDSFKIECPAGSGNEMDLLEVVQYIAKRICKLFLKGEDGSRPANGDHLKFKEDIEWKDQILFYEYFHADTGRGLGASHQTGWTSCITEIMKLAYSVTKESFNENLYLVGKPKKK